MSYKNIAGKLKSYKNSKNIKGMARFGINSKYALGIKIPVLRKMAKEIKNRDDYKDNPTNLHSLADKLWKSKIHEARILASMIDVLHLVSETQMDNWIKDFNSWDLCDQTCMNLFWRHPLAYKKASEWVSLEHEFERRAGFSLIAVLAWHDKSADDEKFERFLPLIQKYSTDERNYVKKAVNWALRQIGKRDHTLRIKSIKIAEDLKDSNNKSARWIGSDAFCELSAKP